MTNGTTLALSRLRDSFDAMKFQMHALEDAADGETLVAVKLCLECLAKDATRFAGVARAGSAILSARLNRHAVAAE